MIKVAVIDSGINEEVLTSRVSHHVLCDLPHCKDVIGHGTMCARLIEENIDHNIEFVSVKIFQNNLNTTELKLLDALKYIEKTDVNIVNMSLSVDLQESKEFYEICSRINAKGTVLISALSNMNRTTLFDKFDNIITVSGNVFFDSKKYWFNGKEAICDIEPVLLECDLKEYDFFGGNSKSTALFTAIVVNSWNSNSNTFEFDKLIKGAEKNVWNKTEICRKISIDHTKEMIKNEDLERIYPVIERINTLCNVSSEDVIKEMDWYAGKIALTANIVKAIVANLPACFGENEVVFMEHFRNINSFINYYTDIKKRGER